MRSITLLVEVTGYERRCEAGTPVVAWLRVAPLLPCPQLRAAAKCFWPGRKKRH